MEGAALRRKNELDLAAYTAWHTAVFALSGYAGKLKDLAEYLGIDDQPNPVALQHAKGIAFFHSLKAKGFDVKIEKNEIN
jgi:hypothetical protein